MLDTDPDFARRALAAIEEAGRTALAELDHVLGLLREDGPGASAPQRDLADLPELLDSVRASGVQIDCTATGALTAVPRVVSLEAYRIVQEGLTNALRHAGPVPVALRLAVGRDELELELTNAAPGSRSRTCRGGRGLAGMRERVTLLHGRMGAGREDGMWRVSVRLPLSPGEAR